MAYRYLCAAELLQYAELLAGLPAFISAPEGIRARGADLISATQPLLPAESARRGDGEVDLLQIDREADLAWAALYHVGHGLTRLPSSDPIGFAARTFQQAVFPNKLHFTRFTMQKQFAHAERLLALIDERGLAVALKPAGFDHLMQNARPRRP